MANKECFIFPKTRITDLQGQVMALYCPWFGAFTTNEADTKNKLAYWHAVRVMSIDELEAHLPQRN